MYRTRLKTCSRWTAVNTSGRLEWVLLSRPLSTTSTISTGKSGSHSHMCVYLSVHGEVLISNHTRRLKARTCFSTQTRDSDQLFRDQMSSLYVFTVQWCMFHSSVCVFIGLSCWDYCSPVSQRPCTCRQHLITLFSTPGSPSSVPLKTGQSLYDTQKTRAQTQHSPIKHPETY